MNKIFLLSLITLLGPIVLLIRIAFIKKRLPTLHWLAFGLFFIAIFPPAWIARYILTKVPSVKEDFGENLSWFLENWYFIYFQAAILTGLVLLFLFKRRREKEKNV